jgi:hypothetical protein
MDESYRIGKGRQVVGVMVLIFLAAASAAEGQAAADAYPDGHEPHPLPPTPGWAAEFGLLGANALVGGVTAGVAQKARGGSFRDGFARGAIGGAVVHGGKRIVVERFDGAGLLGRTVAATGSSVVRNASLAEPSLSYLILPLGPVHLHVDRSAGTAVRAKVDLNNLVLTAYAAWRSDLDFDAGSSLSAGTPVFRASGHLFGAPEDTLRAAGKVVEAVVFLSDLPWRHPAEASEIFAHERVHVLQKDQVFITLSEPLMARAVRGVPALGATYRYVDLHPTDLLFQLGRLVFREYESRPWEVEAFHLMRR